MPGQVGDQIIDAEDHFLDCAFLHQRTVQIAAQNGGANVLPPSDTRSHRAKSVGTLYPQHAAHIRVAQVVQTYVVCDREAGQALPYLVGRNVAHRATDNRSQLTLIVQEFAALREDDLAAMMVESGYRLLKERRHFRRFGLA